MFTVPGIIVKVLQLYQLMIVAWAFGSFFPQWRFQKWYRMLGEVVQPYMNLFRWLPLRMQGAGGGIDFTPLVALLVLQLFERLVATAAMGGH